MRRLFVLGSSLLLLATASCAAIFGFDRLSEGPGEGAEAGGDALASGGDGGTTGDPLCAESGIPGPPTVGTGGTQELYGALSYLDFGLPVDGGSAVIPGYNLDLTCSPTPQTGSCTTDVSPSIFSAYAADQGATGIDNAGFPLISFLSAAGGSISATAFNAGVALGRYGALVHVQGWNGGANDDQVSVEIYPSLGIVDGGAPTRTAKDLWGRDAHYRLLEGVEPSKISSLPTGSYVRDGLLVARFAELSLEVLLSDDPKPFVITLADAVLTTRLATEQDDAGFVDRGTIAGRWKSSAFLGQVREIYIADGNGFRDKTLCEPDASTVYDTVKGQVCNGRDIRADSKDKQGLPCDALSTAARIELYRVEKPGPWVAPPMIPARCTTNVVVPAGDDCAN